jgi:hypothetical protein
MDITTQSTVLFSLCLSINYCEQQLELCKKSCTEYVQYWEERLASLKEAKEKILAL